MEITDQLVDELLERLLSRIESNHKGITTRIIHTVSVQMSDGSGRSMADRLAKTLNEALRSCP